MKKILVFVSIIAAVLLFAAGTEQETVTKFRDIKPDGFRYDTHNDWKYNSLQPLSFREYHISSVSGTDTIAVLIDSTMSNGIDDELLTYFNSIETEGTAVFAYAVNPDADPVYTRMFLDSLYKNCGIEGAFLIGDITPAWAQVEDDYNEYGYAEWPCDYYFMDLNGDWYDDYMYDGSGFVLGSDGVFDYLDGSVEPEIYVARLIVSNIGDDTLLMQEYFSRNENYRGFKLNVPEKALLFIDDDWSGSASYWKSCLDDLYESDSIETVSDKETTRATVYTEYLDSTFEWISLYAHSWPNGHAFYYNNKLSTDYYYASQYRSQNPEAHFYNFFCCSFARYTTSGCGAGCAVFSNYGLGAVGSAKTGSMLNFNQFYSPLGEGKNLGQAFREWFDYIANGGFSEDEIYWHLGMTLIGDPTLKPHRGGPAMITEEFHPLTDNKHTPANGIKTVFYSVQDAIDYIRSNDINVFDKTGRQIPSPSSSGIYFFNNQKIIIF